MRCSRRVRFVRVTAIVVVVAFIVVAAVGAAFARPLAPPPAAGTWSVTVTPTSVRTVGVAVLRDGGGACEDSCRAAYLFAEAGVPDRPYTTFLRLDAAGCEAAPCELRAGPSGFTGTVAWDGTTYTARGLTEYSSDCAKRLPAGSDTMRFTVEGSGDGARLVGTASLALSWVVTGEGPDCRKADGYEVYDGTLTGTFVGAPPGGTSGGTLGGTSGGGGPGVRAPGPPRAPGRAAVGRAAHDAGRPTLSVAVADARALPWDPVRLLVVAFLALLLVLLLPFPAALFNSTLEANYDEVRGWFSWLPRRDQARPLPVPVTFLGVVAAAALLNAFLDPALRLDRASALLVAGLALSIAAVSLLAVLPSRLLRGERASVRVYPLGLVVAALCVLVSRLTSFEPGYLYGVVAGFAFARALRREEQGRLAFVTAAYLLAVALVAFALRVPVHDRAAGGAAGWVLLDTVLAAVFAAGVEANVLGLLPLRFLAGESLLAWRRWAWAAAFGLSVFAFLHALAARAGEESTTASVVVAAVLFAAFGTVSVTFWAYFRFRRPDPTPASV